MRQVQEARANKQFVDLFPDRLDMNKDEVKNLIEKPYEDIIAQTKEELADYQESIETFGLSATIDSINKEIREVGFISEDSDDNTMGNKRIRRSKRNQE